MGPFLADHADLGIPLLPPLGLILDFRKHIRRQKASYYGRHIQGVVAPRRTPVTSVLIRASHQALSRAIIGKSPRRDACHRYHTLYNVIVQIGSLISSQIDRKYDGPYYKQGNSVLVAICALSLVTFLAQRQYLVRLNKKKEEKLYQSDLIAREQDGNKRLDFRFAL